MSEESRAKLGADWKLFLRRHWKVAAVFVAACVLAFIGAIVVFLWFVGNAQSTGLVPSALSLWSMGHLVTFILYLIMWEIVFIGIVVAAGAIIGWRWWTRLPAEEKMQYHFFEKRSRTVQGSGGMSLFFFIAFAIKVYLDGRWNEAIASWSVDYVVGSMIWILVVCALVVGIPLALGGIWWLRREMKKEP